MKNNILKFLEKREAILWINTNNYQEIEKIIFENTKSFGINKVYTYENGLTLNQEHNSFEPTMKNLYTTLDSLYPEGIRKTPIILLIKESIEEILENKNLNYIKEIIETKKENPKYNLTIIIMSNKTLPSQLNNLSIYIEEKEINNKKDIKKCIQILANSRNIQLSIEEIEEVTELFRDNIRKIITLKKKNNGEKVFEETVLVKGGKYKPSFIDDEKELFDIEVFKYQVTQAIWTEIMGNNPSTFKGENKPVETISWWDTLEFCNKLSEKYGLIPVYNIDKKRGILTINQIDGEISFPDKADFSKTEGFRLPTEIEWEWFAIGGKLANKDEKILNANKMEEEAWYYKNSGGRTNNVGLKKPNQLGIYDCIGNVWEWCYDTTEGDIESGKLYVYTALDSRKKYREIRGGSWKNGENTCTLFFRDYCDTFYADSTIGFRIVRTVLI
ncbi:MULTISPECIES: SUMF1/EgtB/PvdO family nonheme iron enzyme [Fusobacterium]|jgi:lipoprotein|uniref:SUMF1/EgtB/PvdO family nonheme iron enzyme n=1 Tax=Fusobacterium TaxID=848 RepID=UPI0004505441|nr:MULTISPECIES: SUMF1/EgtB/PvdO family nonheme iron enzyme [Fusobacterium]EUB31482.1 sulfatase-modifying factor enzyme 1 [Fusobacterium sp. OBRC1]WRL72728.1 SUMF1/EgtB/PvdO family nonheme iron enzyme [Fusobacterium polymorphum]